VITCCIDYTIDPHKAEDFSAYAKAWPPIIERCGGQLVGYYLPKEGANNRALALIDFDDLASYETYRAHLAEDPDARENLAMAQRSRCILVEQRSFLQRA
jgi:NIPSNAP